jgi:hypothetical protein
MRPLSEIKWKVILARKRTVLYIDVLMMFLFLLINAPTLTGLGWHEILGTLVFIPVVVHLLFSW